jgi:hypothetical protein
MKYGQMEPAAEDDAGGLRQHVDVMAHRSTDELEDGGLAGARATGHHDAPRSVTPGAGAFTHDVSWTDRSAPAPPSRYSVT